MLWVRGRVALLAIPCFGVHRAQGRYHGCQEKDSPLGPSMLWGAPLCLRDGLMVLIFGLCRHPRALWYSYSDYAVIQGPYGTHIWIMPSSKGLMVLIFGLCLYPRNLWYSYSDYAVIQGPYGTHIWIMPSSKGLTECKGLLEMQKSRNKNKKKLPYVLYGQTIFWNISFLLQNRSCFMWTPTCDVFKVGTSNYTKKFLTVLYAMCWGVYRLLALSFCPLLWSPLVFSFTWNDKSWVRWHHFKWDQMKNLAT